MSKPILVHVDIQRVTQLVGRLWTHTRRRRQSATFEYDRSWLVNPHRFPLEPALKLGPGPFHTTPDKTLFGAIGDSAPDRWGRVLMRRQARHQAEETGKPQRFLSEVDYLLQVDDKTRHGALRFSREENGSFLTQYEGSSIPPLIDLPRLLVAADHISADSDTDEDIRLLIAPGSSLGGARPKASVRDSLGNLSLVKFPCKSDEMSTVLWEAVALTLAEQSEISVPEWRMESVEGRSVLLLKRFDRKGYIRIPFLSAMSMIDAKDYEMRSYMELADALRMHGAQPGRDMQKLWRRMVFNILISNVDDHMRNHGFLYDGSHGWILSPAYDLNPTPADISPRILSTAITYDDPTASLKTAFDVAEYFEISLNRAREIAAEVGMAVVRWRTEARRFNLPPHEIERMESAFEHKDLTLALKSSQAL